MGDAPDIDGAFLTRLGLKDGRRLGLVRAPEAWFRTLERLAPVDAAPSPARAKKAGVLLVWLEQSDNLRRVFAALEKKIPPDGAVWAVIPKKSALAKGESAVAWHDMQAAGLASGRLVDNKELRFDDRYYGTRFVVRVAARASGRKEHR